MLEAEHSVKATLVGLNSSAHIATRVLLASIELLMIYSDCMKPLNQSFYLQAIDQEVASLIFNIKEFFFDHYW